MIEYEVRINYLDGRRIVIPIILGKNGFYYIKDNPKEHTASQLLGLCTLYEAQKGDLYGRLVSSRTYLNQLYEFGEYASDL